MIAILHNTNLITLTDTIIDIHYFDTFAYRVHT